MRNVNFLLLVVSIISLAACAKAGQAVAEELGIVPSTCGTDGARVQASIDGDAFCADAQIIAVSDGSSVVITGIGLLGSTLSMQVDTLAEGTFPATEAQNAVLFMALGTPYTSVPEPPGTLTITAYDEVTRRLKAELEATVRNEMSGATRSISVSVDVIHSVAGE